MPRTLTIGRAWRRDLKALRWSLTTRISDVHRPAAGRDSGSLLSLRPVHRARLGRQFGPDPQRQDILVSLAAAAGADWQDFSLLDHLLDNLPHASPLERRP